MKVYKFRQIKKDDDFSKVKDDFTRVKEIIETGDFWCSNFWKLNDPMEGVFSFREDYIEIVNLIHNEKKQYKICSFSGEEGFENPAMWGYYANGFKGVAIEVDIKDDKIKKIDYNDNSPSIEGIKNNNDKIEQKVEEILLNKSTAWNREYEYRFLIQSSNESHKIGKITAVYFGAPYDNTVNFDRILKNGKDITKYQDLKKELIEMAKKNNINCYNVKVENGKIKKVDVPL